MKLAHKGSPPKKKPKIGKSQDKVMITVFWDQVSIMMFSKEMQQLTKKDIAFHWRSLRAIKTKRPGLRDTEIKFHQDNARSHMAHMSLNKI